MVMKKWSFFGHQIAFPKERISTRLLISEYFSRKKLGAKSKSEKSSSGGV